jgi:hypothetical protein
MDPTTVRKNATSGLVERIPAARTVAYDLGQGGPHSGYELTNYEPRARSLALMGTALVMGVGHSTLGSARP